MQKEKIEMVLNSTEQIKQGLLSDIIILKNEAIQNHRKIHISSKLNGIIHCFSYRDFEMCCDNLIMYYRERY